MTVRTLLLNGGSGLDYRDTLNDLLARNRGTLVGMQRPWGFGATFSPGGGSNNIGLGLGKETLDAPITAVRAWVFSKEPINESSGWEIIVAPTDKAENDSVTNAFVPQVGGTTYNLYADAAADKSLTSAQYGWRRAQWGGSNVDGRPSKSGALRPASLERSQSPTGTFGAPVFPVPGLIVSDWVDVKSVPATDGRHYMLWRAKKAAVAGETTAFANADYNPAYKNASALPWYRRRFSTGHSGDSIATLTDVPVAPTEANFAWSPSAIAFEYKFAVPVRSVVGCGDSIFEGGGGQSYGLNNWLTQAIGTISTASKPIIPINFGFSTSKFGGFFAQLEQAFAAGLRPTDVIIPNVSYNDFGTYGGVSSGTQLLLAQVQNRLLRAIEMCRRYGARVYVTTDFHNLALNSNVAAYNQLCADIYAFTLQLGAAGACRVIDWRASWVDATHYSPDNIHQNQAGQDMMAGVVIAAFAS
ncbi:SGNH/GDSL hydrolase family protein [Sphingomonas faeni]|uniref:SGNH/GDSL hydrolase family protein n=1 Tax=Sphingomonas faeni TaxID=185950 RepID=UPI00335BE065